VLFNVPKNATSITGEKVGVKGRNDFGKLGYGGPYPPPGENHRYFVWVFALDKNLDLNEGATLKEVLKEMKGHILAYGETMGRYGR